MNTYNPISPKEQKNKWVNGALSNPDVIRFGFDLSLYKKIQMVKSSIPFCEVCKDKGCPDCSPVAKKSALIVFLACVAVASALVLLVIKLFS